MTIFPGCKCCGPCWKCYGKEQSECCLYTVQGAGFKYAELVESGAIPPGDSSGLSFTTDGKLQIRRTLTETENFGKCKAAEAIVEVANDNDSGGMGADIKGVAVYINWLDGSPPLWRGPSVNLRSIFGPGGNNNAAYSATWLKKVSFAGTTIDGGEGLSAVSFYPDAKCNIPPEFIWPPSTIGNDPQKYEIQSIVPTKSFNGLVEIEWLFQARVRDPRVPGSDFEVVAEDSGTFSFEWNQVVQMAACLPCGEDPDQPVDHQCFETPPTESGWLPVGDCHKTEDECNEECGGLCFNPVRTEDNFCERGYTANYANELNVKVYDPDGGNVNGWVVTDVDLTYGACDADEYLKLFLFPNESDIVYNEYDLQYKERFGNPLYELEEEGEFFNDPDVINVVSNIFCADEFNGDGVRLGIQGTDLRMFFAPNKPACMNPPIFDANGICRGQSTGCSASSTYNYRKFFTRLTDEQQETLGREILTGATVQVPAIGELWTSVSCGVPPCVGVEWKLAELKGFITVKMKCEAASLTNTGGRTMPQTKTGPGTHLKEMLEAWGIHAKKGGGCKCKDMEVRMNRLGIACKEPANLKMIVDHLQAEAKKRKLPFVRKAGELLVLRAVKRFEKES